MSEAIATGSNVADAIKLHKAYGALKRYRTRAETAEKSLEEKTKALNTLTTDFETLKTGASVKRVEELAGELRDIKHKEVFKAVAEKAGVNPKGVDDLYRLSGYKAEAELPDEAGMAKLIEAQKGERAYLFTQPVAEIEGEGGPIVEPPLVKPGPAGGQGKLLKVGPKFTEAQLSDPAFVMKNYDAIQKNAAEQMAAGQL